jgi:hypothetical protein
MSRIGPPPGALKVVTDSDEQDEISRLLELEAGNAIKYRTCSWQKVIVYPTPTLTCPSNAGNRRDLSSSTIKPLEILEHWCERCCCAASSELD